MPWTVALSDHRMVTPSDHLNPWKPSRRDHPMARLRRVTWAQLCDYDYISVGRITQSAPAVDIGLDYSF